MAPNTDARTTDSRYAILQPEAEWCKWVALRKLSLVFLLRHEVGVARQQPFAVRFLAQDRERIAGPPDRRAIGRRYFHRDVIPQIGPVAEHPQLADVGCAFDADVFHA